MSAALETAGQLRDSQSADTGNHAASAFAEAGVSQRMTATYSPEDNKLRLYSVGRLPADIYARVRAAGFIYAPRQELFVAPAWSPAREDLLVELCGEIGDEDTSLVERAEERADRFEGYQEKRASDADRAHAAVESITQNIPFGQPILVGHHSERHARKDAERIETGMRKAVKMWETSKYWEQRAAGALAHAKYKELPQVRARRIKSLKADLRRCEAAFTPCNGGRVILQPRWNDNGPEPKRIPHVMTGQGRAKHWTPVEDLPRIKASYIRWMAHYHNRITYETAMLNEQGAGALIAPKPRPKQLPLLNYKVESLPVNHFGRGETWKMIELTSFQFKSIGEDYRGTKEINGTHRVRSAIVKIDAEGKYVARSFPGFEKTAHVLVFLSDVKNHPQPAPSTPAPAPVQRKPEFTPRAPEPKSAEESKFDAMKKSLSAGVKAVAVNNLFPTPPAIAARLVKLAAIEDGHDVLEPSAGTGNILRAIHGPCITIAVEQSHSLIESLRPLASRVICADFLALTAIDLGRFDRIVMNPPFENAADIKHINHARTLLKPGGCIVAICANGPRQRDALMPIATAWIDLEPGSFADSGTQVNTAIVIIEA